MAESFVQVNLNTTAGGKMKTYSSVDGSANTVQVQAAVLVDAAGAVAVGQKTMVASLPVALASDQTALTVGGLDAGSVSRSLLTDTLGQLRNLPGRAPTANVTNVAAAVASTQLLAANALRVGVIIFNDSTSVLYVKFGTAAATTSFTVRVAAAGYYEVPAYYSGVVHGIWNTANGAARVTEVTT